MHENVFPLIINVFIRPLICMSTVCNVFMSVQLVLP